MEFPTWDEVTERIEDSRFFVGHNKRKYSPLAITDYQIAIRTGARIMYDELYVMINAQNKEEEN